jgi:hypothetical protein
MGNQRVNAKRVKKEDNHFLLTIWLGGTAMGWFRSPLRITLLVGGSIIVFIVALVGYNRYQDAQKRAELYAVARLFGYTDGALMSEYQSCYDVIPHCSLSLVYTTSYSQEIFRQRIQASGMSLILTNADYDRALFTDLNAIARVSFAVNGKTAPDASEYPLYEAWITSSQETSDFTIIFFNLASTGGKFTVAGQPVHGNLMQVKIQTR